MVSLAKNLDTKKVKSKFSDEFDSYLKRQCMKTTFNGVELDESFTWYRRLLGLL